MINHPSYKRNALGTARVAVLSGLVSWAALAMGCGEAGNGEPTPPADQTPPTVIGISPADGRVGVPLFGSVVVTFSEPVTAQSAALGITITQDAIPALGGVQVSGSTVTWAPDPMNHAEWLAGYTVYTVNVSEAIEDLAGNALGSPATSSFTTTWTLVNGTTTEEEARGIATDSTGVLYVTGYTRGALVAGGHLGGKDAFLIRYNADRSMSWTKQFGTAGDDDANGVAIDANNNIYVAGSTTGSLPNFTSQGVEDVYVAKFDPTGTELWHRQLGTSGKDVAEGVAVDAANEVAVAGNTDGALAGNPNQGPEAIFVLKYDASGNLLASTVYGSYSPVRDLAVDGARNIITAGYTLGQQYNDAFLVKLNPSAEVLWARQSETTVDDYAYNVSTDSAGNIYVGGTTYGFVYSTAFVHRYDAAGTRTWSDELQSPDGYMFTAMTVDAADNFYWAGYDYTSQRSYLHKYDPTGTGIWDKLIGFGSLFAYLPGRTRGNLLYFATTESAPFFDGCWGPGGWDIYIFKMDTDGNLY